jgi:hypothetical protein
MSGQHEKLSVPAEVDDGAGPTRQNWGYFSAEYDSIRNRRDRVDMDSYSLEYNW